MARRVGRQRFFSLLWLFWLAGVLLLYYKQLWRLLATGSTEAVAFPRLAHGAVVAAGEALSRAAVAVFGAGTVLLAALFLGISLCWLLRWHADDWREGLLYRLSIGLGALSYLSLGLAVVGGYYPISVQVLVGVVVLIGSLFYWHLVCQKKPLLVRSYPSVARSYKRDGDRIWQVIVLVALLLTFIAALAPEIEYDALWYHLGLPLVWLQQGRMVDIPTDYVSLYPLTWELIFGAGLSLGGPIAAKLLHFICLPFTGLLVYQLARRFVPRSSPWLAVAFFITIPIVLWEASTAYIDLALAFHVGLTIYALLRYFEGRRSQWLVLATINLGLALATKHLALFVLIIAAVGLGLRLWLENRNLRRALQPAVVLGLASLLLPLPWYFRSWWASGNPVFPELFGVFGASPPERWDAVTQQGLKHFTEHFGRAHTLLNLLTLPWDMTIHAARYGGTLGPMFLLMLPALILLRRRSRYTSWLMVFVLLYMALWASPISSFQMRFLVPIAPVLAVLAAEACDRLVFVLRSTATRWSRRGLYAGIAVLLVLNLPPFIALHEVDRVDWDGWLTHVIREIPVSVVIGAESQEDYLTRSVPSYAAWRFIDSSLPPDARILTFSGGDQFYSQHERLSSDATVVRPAVWGAPGGQEISALQTLRTLGISHILFDKRGLNSRESAALAIAQPSAFAHWYELQYEDDRYSLYRLRWEDLGSEEAATPTLAGIKIGQPTLDLRLTAITVFLVSALLCYAGFRYAKFHQRARQNIEQDSMQA